MIKLEEARERPEGEEGTTSDKVSGERKHIERIAQMVGLSVGDRGVGDAGDFAGEKVNQNRVLKTRKPESSLSCFAGEGIRRAIRKGNSREGQKTTVILPRVST